MTPVDGAGAPFGVESSAYVAIRFVQFCSLIVLLGAVPVSYTHLTLPTNREV